MQLIRVTDQELAREFVKLPQHLHPEVKTGVRVQQKYLLSLIKNKAQYLYEGSEAEFWVVTNYRGETIGRIAAFARQNSDSTYSGYIGLFDCINHLKAASLLFDECKNWLSKYDVQSMEGPCSIHPFQIEGISLKNFSHLSPVLQNNQASFFSDLFEFYGFKSSCQDTLLSLSFDFSFSFGTDKNLLPKGKYEFVRLDKSNLEKSVKDLFEHYSASVDQHIFRTSRENLEQWVKLLFQQALPPFIWLVYAEGSLLAYSINICIENSETGTPVKEPLWKQLTSKFSAKKYSLLNLKMHIPASEDAESLKYKLISLVFGTITTDASLNLDRYLILEKHISADFGKKDKNAQAVDKLVKFAYKFDQEPLIGTFAKTKIKSPE